MPDIFLSYSRDDQPNARRFAEGFERAGLTVWWDQALHSGEDYDKVTEKALEDASAVVVLWSKKSVDSRWVRAEATQADRAGTLVPAMIESCKRPIMFELKQTADLSGWSGDPNDRTWQAFLASVRRLVDKGDPSPTTIVPIPARPRRINVPGIAITAAVLLIACGALWKFNGTSTEQTVQVQPAGASEATLAVLPFVNLSSDPEQEYFSDGLTEEILNKLAQIKNLAVTARTSSFSFKGKNEDMRVIGEKLGVANLLEGSVRKDGRNLRITAQLINATNGAHLWSQTYDRELSGVFKLQEDVAKDVANALSITLDVGDLPRAQGGTTSIEAYDKYLQAQAILRQEFMSERVVEAAQLLRGAVELDPGFVGAWQALTQAARLEAVWKPERTDALREEAARAEARVVELAPEGEFAQEVRFAQLLRDRKWFEAQRMANAAVESGADQLGFGMQTGFLYNVGRLNEALVLQERQRQRDPLNLSISSSLQNSLSAVGRSAEAEAEYERSKALVGDHGRIEHFAILRILAREGADRSTVKVRLRTTLDRAPLAISPNLIEKLDDAAAARAMVRKAYDDPANKQWTRMIVVSYYAGIFGDNELAVAALRRSVIDLGGPVANIWPPYSPSVRAEPAFKQLLRDVGLVDYWRASGNWGDFCKPVGTEDFECM